MDKRYSLLPHPKGHDMEAGEVVPIVITAFLALAGVAVTLRCITRFLLVKKCMVEDVMVIVAFLSSISLTCVVWRERAAGLGNHKEDVSRSKYVEMMKCFYAGNILYYLCLTLTKLSILIQFLRFFVDRVHRLIAWCLVAIVLSGGIGFMLGCVFLCSPIPIFWDHSIPDGKCLPLKLAFMNSGFNILSDITICVLPFWVLRPLNVGRRQRRFLNIVFGLGGCCCLAAIARLYPISRIVTNDDYSFNMVQWLLWSTIEVNIGMTCGALPLLTPLINRMWPKLLARGRAPTPSLNTIVDIRGPVLQSGEKGQQFRSSSTDSTLTDQSRLSLYKSSLDSLETVVEVDEEE